MKTSGLFFAFKSGPRLAVGILFPALLFLIWAATAFALPVTLENIREAKSIIPYLSWTPDNSFDIVKISDPLAQKHFQALQWSGGRGFPLSQRGPVWLKLILVKPLNLTSPTDESYVLNLGPETPTRCILYYPKTEDGQVIKGEWASEALFQDAPTPLPEPGLTPMPVYIYMDETPGLWFAPTISSTTGLKSPLLPMSLILPAIIAVAILVCLLRSVREKTQWPLWAALFLCFILLEVALPRLAARGFGPHAGHVVGALSWPAFLNILSRLAAGIALMLFPHLGRHLLNTKDNLPVQDAILTIYPVIGAVLCLVPLVPGMEWLAKLVPLWPLLLIPLLPVCFSALSNKSPGSLAYTGACVLPVIGALFALYSISDPALSDLGLTASLWGLALGGVALVLARGARSSDMAFDLASDFTNGDKNLPDDALMFKGDGLTLIKLEAEENDLAALPPLEDRFIPVDFSSPGKPPKEALSFGPAGKPAASAGFEPLAIKEDLPEKTPTPGTYADPAFEGGFAIVRPAGEKPAGTSEADEAGDTDADTPATTSVKTPSEQPGHEERPPSGVFGGEDEDRDPDLEEAATLAMEGMANATGAHEGTFPAAEEKTEAKESPIEHVTEATLADVALADIAPEDEALPGSETPEQQETAAHLPEFSAQSAQPEFSAKAAQEEEISSLLEEAGFTRPTSIPLNVKVISLQEDVPYTDYTQYSEVLEELASPGPRQTSFVGRDSYVFNLPDLVREVHEVVRPLAKAKNLLFSWFVSPSLPSHLEGDASRLRQALSLLMQNSVHVTDPGGAVQLTIRRNPSSSDSCELLFMVNDNGAPTRTDAGFFHAWDLAVRTGGAFSVEYSPDGGTLVSFTARFKLPGKETLDEHFAYLENARPASTADKARLYLPEAFAMPEGTPEAAEDTHGHSFSSDAAAPGEDGEESSLRDAVFDELAAALIDSPDKILKPVDTDPFSGIPALERKEPFTDPIEDRVNSVLDGTHEDLDEVYSSGPLQVIIAETTASHRRLLAHYMGSIPHTHLEAHSPGEVIMHYRRKGASLIIFDGDMPEVDIIRVIQEIRSYEQQEELPAVPFLALTSHEAQSRRMVEAGCGSTLAKPFSRNSLERAVQYLVPELSPQEDTAQPLEQERKRASDINLEKLWADHSHSVPNGETTAALNVSLKDVDISAGPLPEEDSFFTSAEDPQEDNGQPVPDESPDEYPADEEPAFENPPRNEDATQAEDFAQTGNFSGNASGNFSGDLPSDLQGDFPGEYTTPAEAEAPAYDQAVTAETPFFTEENVQSPDDDAEQAGGAGAAESPTATFVVTEHELDRGPSFTDGPTISNAPAPETAPAEETESMTSNTAGQDSPGERRPLIDLIIPEELPDGKTASSAGASVITRDSTPKIDESFAINVSWTISPSKDDVTGGNTYASDTPADNPLEFASPEQPLSEPAAEEPDEYTGGQDAGGFQQEEHGEELSEQAPSETAQLEEAAVPAEPVSFVEPMEPGAEEYATIENTEEPAQTQYPESELFPLPGLDESIEANTIPLIPGLIHALRDALADTKQGCIDGSTILVQEAVGRLAGKAEMFDLHTFARLARCVERAAEADDMEAVETLMVDLENVSKRYLKSLQECYESFLSLAR